MTKLKRYIPEVYYVGGNAMGGSMKEHPNGLYVSFVDVEAYVQNYLTQALKVTDVLKKIVKALPSHKNHINIYSCDNVTYDELCNAYLDFEDIENYIK